MNCVNSFMSWGDANVLAYGVHKFNQQGFACDINCKIHKRHSAGSAAQAVAPGRGSRQLGAVDV